jgi:TonB family protein
MTALADGLMTAGPRPKELWQTAALSILLHGVLLAVVIVMPRFRIGTYVTVPVSYTVNLVSVAPGGRSAAAPPAPAAPPAAPATPPARIAPAPPPAARSSEELTLPGKRPAKPPAREIEPSLRPPSVTGRETLRPAAPTVRTQPQAAPAAPVAPAAPAPPAAAVGPAPASTAAGTGSAKSGGIELAGGTRGEGSGGSALGYYLGLVDYKIQTNWNPVASGAARETVVVIRFRVLRSGNVRDVELETSSGDAGLDNAAMRAIRQSIPLPPFPNLLTEPFLDLRYNFVMERG